MSRGVWKRLKAFEYPARPRLEHGESLVAVFSGVRARVTLTDRRIIVSRLGHRSFAYEDVVDLSGGRYAGPSIVDLRDNGTISGGIYLHVLTGGEEWAHVPGGERAAALIRERTPNLWIEHGQGVSIDEWSKQLRASRNPGE